jgi:hypothetical protein
MHVTIELPNGAMFSEERFDGKARIYCAREGIPFDFTHASASLVVCKPTSADSASIFYFSGVGSPTLTVFFGNTGEVVRHETGVARCGGVHVNMEPNQRMVPTD